MRCSKCGKKIKKKSSFCMNCGAKVPPVPIKIKRQKNKDRKERSKARIIVPAVIILFLGLFTFLLFGGDKVPERIRSLKGYSILTGTVRDKLPEQIKLPFDLPDKFSFELPDKFPFTFSFKLPFDLPEPGSLPGGSDIPDQEKIEKDLTAYVEKSEDKPEFDSLAIEKRTTEEEEKKDIVYVVTETENEGEIRSDYYRLLYRRHLIGGWKLKEVEPYNVSGEKISVAGVDNKTVVSDQILYADISSGWKHSNVKVLEHYTDVGAGLDTVVVYMELENDYVIMAGTKEVTYRYDPESETWEAVNITKLSALFMEPVSSVR